MTYTTSQVASMVRLERVLHLARLCMSLHLMPL
jgi:hypothetical protein